MVLVLQENLREFMINYIQSLKDSREEEATDAPNLFDETNIRAMFGMFDVTNRGYITRNQYVEGGQHSLAQRKGSLRHVSDVQLSKTLEWLLSTNSLQEVMWTR